ncbi:hypothetical protein PG997_013645 [Apiospora hydei]|uniref:NADAR domain-containing protein n=1 Tax=Apiospora hydei TaxID=1337664 RepID=A0ABR1V6S8_9PEZI
MSSISFKGFDGSASTTPDSPVVFFWGTNETYGMFSQWYTAGFFCDEKRFATAEQYMMYRKAEAFGDAGAAAAILRSPKKHPRQHKAMGRNVKGFRDDVWDVAGVEAVVVGNLCKFTQNPALMAALLGTAGSVLAEASPYDHVWGIGFKEEYAMDSRHAWGANKLGKCLMIVRDIIQHMSDTQGFNKITSTDAIAQICSDRQTDTSADGTVPDKTRTDTNDTNTSVEEST